MPPVTDGFTHKRITVMGLGRFGGGVGVTRWLCSQGAKVLLTDLQDEQALAKPLSEIGDLIESGQVTLRLGAHREEDFRPPHCDLVVANPAVPMPWANRYLLAAQNSGVPITTEVRLTVERLNRQRTIGVTGTAGKSTTAAMIHHLLNRMELPVHLGGNIGGSLLNSLDSIHHNDWIVLELSSAMLHWLGAGIGHADFRGWSPHIAVLTNLAPNHIDWHGSFEHYGDSKYTIFRYQTEGDFAIATTRSSPAGAGDTGRISPLKIPGAHNQVNSYFALEAVQRAMHIPPTTAAPLLEDFPGLPHRLQLVAESDGLRFFNDSKSTTPEATLRAVAAFDDPSKIHLIAGGYDKKIDLSPIANLSPDLGGLYTIGATGAVLAQASHHAEFCETLGRAVERALKNMRRADILLLSPGCASWDQFTNYEERGEAFVNAVARLSRPFEIAHGLDAHSTEHTAPRRG